MANQLNQLRTQLRISGLLEKNPPLFQVINSLIEYLRTFENTSTAVTSSSSSSIASLLLKTFLTSTDETGTLINSRELLAGLNVTFDDSVDGERTINVSSPGSNWSVLTNGDSINPDLIYAGGDVIMTEIA